MAGAAVTRSLLPLAGRLTRRGGRKGACRHPPGASRSIRHSLGSVQYFVHGYPLASAVTPPGSLAHGDGTPGPLQASTVFRFELDPVLAFVLLAAAIVYLIGVYRLEPRCDHRAVPRTVSFLVPGRGGIASVTMTGIGSYDTTLLSVHMVQHMVL